MDKTQTIEIINKQFLKLGNELYELILETYGESESPPLHELALLESILHAHKVQLALRLGVGDE